MYLYGAYVACSPVYIMLKWKIFFYEALVGLQSTHRILDICGEVFKPTTNLINVLATLLSPPMPTLLSNGQHFASVRIVVAGNQENSILVEPHVAG